MQACWAHVVSRSLGLGLSLSSSRWPWDGGLMPAARPGDREAWARPSVGAQGMCLPFPGWGGRGGVHSAHPPAWTSCSR